MIRHLIVASMLTLAGPALGQSTTLQGDYSILERMSIFSRQRMTLPAPPKGDAPSAGRGPSVKPPVFVGAMKVDTGMVAMVQVFSTDGKSEFITVEPGETIHWGTNSSQVLEITMDTMRLSGSNGRPEELAMGNGLRSAPATGLAESRSSRMPGTTEMPPRSFRSPVINPVNGIYSPDAARFTAQAVVQDREAPELDPPLPPGSPDDIEGRMRARRAAQLAGID